MRPAKILSAPLLLKYLFSPRDERVFWLHAILAILYIYSLSQYLCSRQIFFHHFPLHSGWFYFLYVCHFFISSEQTLYRDWFRIFLFFWFFENSNNRYYQATDDQNRSQCNSSETKNGRIPNWRIGWSSTGHTDEANKNQCNCNQHQNVILSAKSKVNCRFVFFFSHFLWNSCK